MAKRNKKVQERNRSYPVHAYLLNPYHLVTVDVIGVGGNGSQVLIALARLNQALLQTDRKGMIIRAWDPSPVRKSNIVRQQFYPADIGLNKANVMIQRINRTYGYNWISKPQKYELTDPPVSNFAITCIDSFNERKIIGANIISQNIKTSKRNENLAYYNFFWIDLGNTDHIGQIIMGTTGIRPHLNSILDFQWLNKIEIDPLVDAMTPSCSAQESINAQGLFMNSILGMLTGQLMWDIFSHIEIDYRGFFVNLQSGRTAKLPLWDI